MPKQKKLFEAAHLAGIWPCQKMSSSVMKIFVPVITFFKTHILVMRVMICKLDEIGVKAFLEPYPLLIEGVNVRKIGRCVSHLLTSPFEKGGLRGISRGLKSPLPPLC
jgi:hypothetical protein